MIQHFSFLFLLTIAIYGTMLSFDQNNVEKNGGRLYTGNINHLKREPFVLNLRNGLVAGTGLSECIDDNTIDLKKPYLLTDASCRASDFYFSYPIEHVIDLARAPAALKICLEKGTPVNGFEDYNPLKHVLYQIVNFCCTKGTTTLKILITRDEAFEIYKKHLEILLNHKADLEVNFPAHTGRGPDPDTSYGKCNALNYLEKAQEKAQNTNKMISLERFQEIQNMLNLEAQNRQEEALAARSAQITQPNNALQPQQHWLQSRQFLSTMVGLGAIAALFLATRWQYPGFFDRLTMPKMPTLLKRY